MKHAMKPMWGCIVLAALAIGLAAGGAGYAWLPVLGCVAMMGMMVWMMMRMSGGAK